MTFHLTTAQRVASAKKAAATRRAKGEKPFGGKLLSHEARMKAAATRKARGENNLAHLSPEARHLRAEHAAATRKLHGVKPFAHMTATQRNERAKKAAITRRARGH